MTYPDKTVYPVASCNDKDFQNLMDVYMDAVLHPNIYKEEKIFRQEGWHYELEAKDQPMIYNGVVYNEMKGAYSSPERSRHPSSRYTQHRCKSSAGPLLPAHNASPPGGKSSLLYKYSDEERHPYRHPSDSGSPYRCSLQPDKPSCPDRSWHLKRYSASPSPAPQKMCIRDSRSTA